MANNEIISKIIESNLLASSPSRLASDLGYAGRMSINRLRAGSAGEEASQEFFLRISDVIGINKDDIETIGRLIDLTDEFSTQMVNEKGILSDDMKFEIVCSFIDDNYSIFSESYRQLTLNKWLLLKGHESEMFFYLLAFFLLTDKRKSFYGKKMIPREQYSLIIEPLQRQLKEKYPSHTIGNGISRELLQTPLARLAYPCFLTALRLAGSLLKGYVSDYSDANNHDLIIKIPGLPERSFWDEGDDRNKVSFLKYIPVNDKGNGLYEYFQYNIQTGKTGNDAHFYFYGEKNMGIFLKKERELFFGHYSFDGEHLKLVLIPQRDHTLEYTWRLLTPEGSQHVREIDRLFTDSYINNVRYETLGIELSCGLVISEVAVTKTKVILITPERHRYSISRTAYPFLKSVTPDVLPLAYRDLDDNRVYIEWEQLGCRIPLDEFIKR